MRACIIFLSQFEDIKHEFFSMKKRGTFKYCYYLFLHNLINFLARVAMMYVCGVNKET